MLKESNGKCSMTLIWAMTILDMTSKAQETNPKSFVEVKE
jgi:hypothetical protein